MKVSGTHSSLRGRLGYKIKLESFSFYNRIVYHGANRRIGKIVIFAFQKETRVAPFLHNDNCKLWSFKRDF
jgi:hypothetical protein